MYKVCIILKSFFRISLFNLWITDKVVSHTILGIVVVLKKVIFWWNLKPATNTCSWISYRRCFRIHLLTLLILTFVDGCSNLRIFWILIFHLVNFFSVIRKRLTCLQHSRVSPCLLMQLCCDNFRSRNFPFKLGCRVRWSYTDIYFCLILLFVILFYWQFVRNAN